MEGGSGRASCTAGWSKRLSAFRFPFSFRSFRFVIAGLDPAIHAEAKRDQTFSRLANRESPWTTGSSPVVTRSDIARTSG
jgi:hypothetical protein